MLLPPSAASPPDADERQRSGDPVTPDPEEPVTEEPLSRFLIRSFAIDEQPPGMSAPTSLAVVRKPAPKP
jgi:hypothetical protein